jgi:Mg2+/Co2+ transporter CorC
MNDIKAVPRERWADTTVANIIQPCSAATAIAPDLDVVEVLSIMNRTGNSRFLVMEDNRLVGVLTLKDVLRFLSVRLDLEQPEKVNQRVGRLEAQERGLGQQA